MRIKLIISHYLKKGKPEFYFDSVNSSYSNWSEIKKLLLETVKITRTFFLMKVMRENVVSEED
jgi:EAL domain-containing protein (putative c-di-GMP-specific phosphodiesterase class I)